MGAVAANNNGTVADIKFSIQAGGSVTVGGVMVVQVDSLIQQMQDFCWQHIGNAANFIKIGKRVGTTKLTCYITHGTRRHQMI